MDKENMNSNISANPFLNKTFGTPYETVPFDKIRFEHYEEAMMEGMKRDDADIERITSNPELPTFENTIIPKGDRTLTRVSNVFFNLISADTNDEMDALAQKMSPILTEHSNKIMFNEALWQRVQAIHADHRPLEPEEQTLLDNMYQSFVRHGALLSPEEKEEFMRLQMELSQVTLQYQQNVLKDTNAFQLLLTEETQLCGLPDSQREAAALAAREQGKEGWLFTLHAPSYGPFMMYADDRELRRQMYMAHMTICTHDNENNNLPLVPRIVNLRRQLANILGYKTFADFILVKRCAENIQNVERLLRELLEAYMPAARREMEEVTALARETEGPDYELKPWDFSYYSHKLRMLRYNIDSEMLRPYFELSQVKQGIFGLATRLYGITFHKRTDIAVYHPDVEAWEVQDEDGSYLGILYTDFHPRASKQSGAWMTTYKEQWIDEDDGSESRPHASVTMNFTKPTDTKPALLTLGEVETFLHEFGHSLHALFSKVRFESLSCTNVYWDFVELPSQFMENYVTEPEFLNTFARHYETGESMPQELIDRIIRSKNFMCGYACVRQVSLGLLDLAYYTLEQDFDADVLAFEQEAWKDAQLMRPVEGTCMSVQFSHIMSGGYAAGYYSYKWAEVLDADAFAVFKEHGIFDRETANRFRNEVLSRGATEAPMTLYRRFRGQEPTIDALLKRNGIKHG
ncbi:MAG: M3 family metallopeptidase [Bacteroidaceae bacterium]|nr:M3 family metallopeptidase [Bacteroidaceae bacterium]